MTRILTLDAAAFVPINHNVAASASLSIGADGGLRCNVAQLTAVTAAFHLPAGSTITKVEAISNPGASDPTFSFETVDLSTQTVTPISSKTAGTGSTVTRTALVVNHVVDQALGYRVTFTALYTSIVLYGAQITYSELSGGFTAINPTPRVFNTRDNHAPKLADGEERIVPLTVPAHTTAVINLTITETEGAGGYVACFPADATWPGNSNIN